MRRAGHLTLALLLGACTQNGAVVAPTSAALPAAGAASKIQHVVIIFQENRSFDNLFNGFPGADTVRSGLNSKGERVPLRPIGLTAPYDLSHEHFAFETEYANGKLNGFDKEPSGCIGGIVCPSKQIRAYGFVPHAQSKPYFTMASEYTVADRMFQTNQGPSFPAHQYIVSGTSAVTNGSSLRAAENPLHYGIGGAGGCDSPAGALVALINPGGRENQKSYPCFKRISLMELLDKKGLSWRYYQATPGPGIWNGPDAVLQIRTNKEYAADVVTPPSRVLTDIANGDLADVAWVTPTALASDHAQSNDGSGPSWVAAVVNAIGESAYWNNYGNLCDVGRLGRLVRSRPAAPLQLLRAGFPGAACRDLTVCEERTTFRTRSTSSAAS